MKSSIFRILALALLLPLLLWAGSPSIAAAAPPGPRGPAPTPRAFLPLVPNRMDAAWRWSASSTLSLRPAPSRAPVAFIDRSGRLNLLWDTFPTGGSTPIYHSLQTPSGWSAAEKVAALSGTSKMLAPPLIGKDGKAHFLWYNQMGLAGPYRLLYSAYDGLSWSQAEEVYRSSSASLTGLLHFDEAGSPQVLVKTHVVDLILYLTARSQTGWSTAVQILADPFAVWHSWGLAPDAKGGVSLLMDDYSGRFAYSYWKNGAFVVKDRQISGTAGGRLTQSDSQGNIHLAWMGSISFPGGAVNGLYHQCLTGGVKLGDRLALSGTHSLDAFRSATDGGAQVVYAWKQPGRVQVGLALLDGCEEKLYKDLVLPALPGLSRWTGLEAAGVSSQPQKVCLLLKISSGEYGALCAAPAR